LVRTEDSEIKLSEVELPSNRKFGLFFTAVFAVVFAYFYWSGQVEIGAAFALLAVVFAVVSVVRAELLLPLNKLWMRFGLLLGMIVSPIVLGAMFFLIFTPVAIGMRLFGRDELRLKMRNSQTHWKVRDPSGPSSESFKQQF